MEPNKRPDIIVAVDLGTTFTGNNALQSPIQVIYNWPGCSTRNEQKVHTCLVYGKDERPTSWGFVCEDDDDFEMRRREFFKIFLDKMNLLEAQIKGLQGAPESVAQAQKFVTDYLGGVYVHVKSTIEHQTGIGPFTGWKDLAVEFLFSVPTTWRSFEIINTFKEAIRNAGFGTEGPRHFSTVDLTESEAAAVATIKSTAISFEKDDIFLSVDAGGGTTDFALMQVVETREPFPTLKQLTQVDGVGIGSTLIDRAFLDLVEDRVFPFSELVEQLPPDCIEKLVRSDKFRTAKHKFGERVYNAAVYKLPMEGVGEDMQSIFDPHINSMLKKIREQLDFVQLKAFGNPQVRFLILSGGLGSSAYVRDRLQQELSLNPHPNAANIKIVQAHDPQLVVVKGLILDRLQKLESGDRPVLATRKARASYGVMCKMKYNPEIHFQEELKTDPLDGQLYAMSQIDWLIRKGDDIDPNVPIISTFSQKIAKGSAIRHWDSVIVISHSEREFLPVSMKDSGAKQLCTVRSDLSGVRDSELEPMRQKKSRGLFSRSARWYNCTYEVRALVGAADLTFQLWFNGQRFSKNHSPIRVTWDEEGAAAQAGVVGGGGEDGAVAAGGLDSAQSRGAVADTGSVSGSSPVGSVSGVSALPSDVASHTSTSSLGSLELARPEFRAIVEQF
ncbi:hypothetical protein J7T55_014464 [Diaporthe amygdali]|uniref:uncharacterized protein n=1 Tax=Phomopsis amygdali TaxID=1214568 RepID=UPI0022FDD484|nr:uncharacterized protein J7T55_014464 [Diaporthe amygdali]KAJ0118011.1 hypothetical protein J7T55_014464 [Diaporthe amygdali]